MSSPSGTESTAPVSETAVLSTPTNSVPAGHIPLSTIPNAFKDLYLVELRTGVISVTKEDYLSRVILSPHCYVKEHLTPYFSADEIQAAVSKYSLDINSQVVARIITHYGPRPANADWTALAKQILEEEDYSSDPLAPVSKQVLKAKVKLGEN